MAGTAQSRPPKSLQRPIHSNSLPARQVSRSTPSQLRAGQTNAKGGRVPAGKPNDPKRTGATDPRYHRKAVENATHEALEGMLTPRDGNPLR